MGVAPPDDRHLSTKASELMRVKAKSMDRPIGRHPISGNKIKEFSK
jgi:hypothetical protein